MSIVIGLKHNDTIYLASDSQITTDGQRKYINHSAHTKVWHPQNKPALVMGSVGWVRERNIAQTASSLFGKNEEDSITHIGYQFLITHTIPELITLLEANKALKDTKDTLRVSNNYLIGVQDKLYELGTDLSLIEIDRYTAIGSGAVEAISYLDSIVITDPRVALLKAMTIAKKRHVFIDFPVIIAHTNDLKVEVYHSKEEYCE